MKPALKSFVKDKIATKLKALKEGEFTTLRELILNDPDIVRVLYYYNYTLNNHKTIPYVRRLTKEVVNDAKYSCGHISSMLTKIKRGRREKKEWVWGYPTKDRRILILEGYDKLSSSALKAGGEKAKEWKEVFVPKRTLDTIEAFIKPEVKEEKKEVKEKREKKEVEVVE